MDKSESNDIHFARRLKEKLGWDLTDQMRDQIHKSITPAGFVKKISKKRSLYVSYIRGVSLMIVYDEVRKSIITAYPNKK